MTSPSELLLLKTRVAEILAEGLEYALNQRRFSFDVALRERLMVANDVPFDILDRSADWLTGNQRLNDQLLMGEELDMHGVIDRIANTETQRFLGDQYALETGPMRWVATVDGETRESHLELDGQVRVMGQPFEYSGGTILHPGDWTAPLSEVINCRCVLVRENRK